MTKTQILPSIERIINGQNIPEIPTYIINLDRRTDRWETVYKKALDSNIVCFERYSAVDGQKLIWNNNMEKLFSVDDNLPKNKSHCYRRGVLGCALSHYYLWDEMLRETSDNNDDEILIVFEDDINFDPEFASKWSKLYPILNKDKSWGLFYFGFIDSHVEYDDGYVFRDNISIRLFNGKLRKHGGGTFSYAIRKWAARELIKIANEEKIQRGIDWFMFDQFSKIRSYWVEPNLITSSALDTDIQNNFETIIKN